VELWGDPDPCGQNPLHDFNSTVELYRELLGAMYRNVGGAPNVRAEQSVWQQPTNDRRLGRLLVLPLAWGADLADEPYTIVPFANPGVPGESVQVDLTVVAVAQDGSSTETAPIIFP